ncbi:hypothetical protein IC232_03480 [Microvirga sp. BT688]|uniref:hypothetical protein n=1 Tax=Microvirga sp. TaxID=1873136 RepID=UPI001685B55C|nr:hypothetical protein [Microvirga sp.]MBD2745751.1 hypothetical protein [Microvirga sp.]
MKADAVASEVGVSVVGSLLSREFAPYPVTNRVEIQTRVDGRFMIVLFGEYIPLETLLGGRLVLTPSPGRVRIFVRHYVDETYDEAIVLIAECPDPKPELLEVCRVHEFLDVLIYNQTKDPLQFQNLIAWVDEE